MLYFLTAAALILHTYFWGCGLAWLVLPARWRGIWWMVAPGLGLALQSAVVWFMAHLPVAGTDAYAIYSELLPLALVAAVWRRGVPLVLARWRALIPVALLMAVVGWTLLSPMTQRGGWTLTSSSLGSNDHADYAAGARVFKEFSRSDRTGFMGQPEVTQVGSTRYFFDFWLRLNHFTPSAVIAHNGTVLGLEPYQLVSLSAALLVLLNLPPVLLLLRITLGLRGWNLAAVGLLYGLSPLTAYAVHHGALGQLYAAHGIALLTSLGLLLPAAVRRSAEVRAFTILALAAVWLLAGSYNFILTVAFVPAIAWLVLDAIYRGTGGLALRSAGALAVATVVCVVLFWGRFDGMAERFRLFDKFDFGWPVALLSPEGWLGLVRDSALQPWPDYVRSALSLLVLLLAGFGFAVFWRRQRSRALMMLAVSVPVLCGWCLLAWESRQRANASYDAFKLISVFYPGLLAAFVCWTGALVRFRRTAVAMGLLLAVLAGNLWPAVDFWQRMARPPLRVESAHVEIGRLESDSAVTSLNMRIESFWARLWANSFLLRKQQYFQTHTYEGRLNTELRGEWDLIGSLVRSEPLRANDIRIINSRFHAVRVNAPGFVRAQFGTGWYPIEGTGINRWRWSAGEATLILDYAGQRPRWVRLDLRGRAITPREVELWYKGRKVQSHAIDGTLRTYDFGNIRIEPGQNRLEFISNVPPARGVPGDERALSFVVHNLVVRSLPAPANP